MRSKKLEGHFALCYERSGELSAYVLTCRVLHYNLARKDREVKGFGRSSGRSES